MSSRFSESMNSADSRKKSNITKYLRISFTQNEIPTILFIGIAFQLFNAKRYAIYLSEVKSRPIDILREFTRSNSRAISQMRRGEREDQRERIHRRKSRRRRRRTSATI